LGVPQLAELLGLNKPQTWELLGQLQEEYNTEKRGLELREVAEGWQLCTKACHHEAILQLANTQELKLSNASMETLAIIAYRQPVTRAEMEAIRGVKVDGVVNTLLECSFFKSPSIVLGQPIT
ncbi:MAG: SMC-Scp complex subunit ScpB, partial [Bacteroidaceae bacterium]|nr:SMC-Scp complex subunit ScpB [Bacteroidaceae bacterium]